MTENQNQPTEHKLSSLSIFFPFYNDEGTVQRQIKNAYETGSKLTDDLEVIAIHGGNSKDNTYSKILEEKREYPDLVVVDKKDNWEGYAVIKYGFSVSTKDWVFYTDGDAQYHLEEDLPLLVSTAINTGADVVNGYKKSRQDSFLRILLGNIYAKFSSIVFELPIRDTDCDFRLMRTSFLKRFSLDSHDASILFELIKKLDLVGAKFVEVPVSHYHREYGTSNYNLFSLIKEKIVGDTKLYFKMRKHRSLEDKNRVVRFGSVGIVSIIIQTILYNVGLAFTTLAPFVLSFLADQFAILISFFLNSKYTFKQKPTPKKFVEFYTTVIISTLIQSSVIAVVVGIFGRSVIISNVGFALGLVVAFLWNYGINSRIIWKRRPKN